MDRAFVCQEFSEFNMLIRINKPFPINECSSPLLPNRYSHHHFRLVLSWRPQPGAFQPLREAESRFHVSEQGWMRLLDVSFQFLWVCKEHDNQAAGSSVFPRTCRTADSNDFQLIPDGVTPQYFVNFTFNCLFQNSIRRFNAKCGHRAMNFVFRDINYYGID